VKQVPERLRETWWCQRLLLEHVVTVTELETIVSVDDVALLIEASDFWAELNRPIG
jgi:hypothetical protein